MLDIIIRNANIIDGSNNPAFIGSVGIQGDRIDFVQPGDCAQEAKTVLDGTGLVCCPGFIDIHSHADLSIPFFPEADNYLMQGITSFVAGNCGMSIAPAVDPNFNEQYMQKHLALDGFLHIEWTNFHEWIDYVQKKKIGANYVPLVGHNALRGSVMSTDYARPSTQEEVEQIASLLEEALDAGAFGMSYSSDAGVPGHHADQKELNRLFRILEERDSYITVHTRHHQYQWPSEDGRSYYGVYIGEKSEVICGRYHGFVEFIEYLKRTPKLRAMIAHFSNAFIIPIPHSQAMEDALLDETLRVLVDESVGEGYPLWYCVIPSGQSLGCVRHVLDNMTFSMQYNEYFRQFADPIKLVEALRDHAFREKYRAFIKGGTFKIGVIAPVLDPYWANLNAFVSARDKSIIGKTLMEVTRERMDGTIADLLYTNCYEVLFDLLVEDPALEWACVMDRREQGGFQRLLAHPRSLPMTDSPAFPMSSDKFMNIMGYGNPPFFYSSFLQYLTAMSRDSGILPLNEAIHRITSLPAEIMRIIGRGRLEAGNYADIVMMDWGNVKWFNDFNNPSKQPEGIINVLVNGKFGLRDGVLTHALSGRVLLDRPKCNY